MEDVFDTKIPNKTIGEELVPYQGTRFQHEDWNLMEPITYFVDERRALDYGEEMAEIPVSASCFIDSQIRLIRASTQMTHLERLRLLSIVEGNIFGWFEEQLCKYRPDTIDGIMESFQGLLEQLTNATHLAACPITSEAFTDFTCCWRRKDRKIVVLDRSKCGLKQGMKSKNDADLLLRASQYRERLEHTRDVYFETGGNRYALNGTVLGSVQILWVPHASLNLGFDEERWVRIFRDRSPMSPQGYRYAIAFSEPNDVLLDRLIMKIHGTVSDRSQYLPQPRDNSLIYESMKEIDGIPVEGLVRTPIWTRISDELRDRYQRESSFADIDLGFYIEKRFNIDFFDRLHDIPNSNMGLVHEIWMTIYRTDEAHWGGLLRKWAYQLRSNLHVFVELTASSEADRNSRLANDLMDIGADVKVSIPGGVHVLDEEIENFDLKVHGKMLRMDTTDCSGKDRSLVVMSTGNFSALAQSKFHDSYYIQYRPSDKGDPFPNVTAFFEFLWTGKVNDQYADTSFTNRKLYFLPYEIRERVRLDIKGITRISMPKENHALLDAVEKALGTSTEPEFDTQVISTSDQMRPFVFIKTNHLTDGKVLKYLEKFLQNPQATIFAIVRTTMGAENLLEYPNFICRTVMGSYLEHDRYFFTGMMGARTVESLYREAGLDPEDAPEWKTLGRNVPIPTLSPDCVAITSAYVMSADLMERNLSRRVECMMRLSPGMAEAMLFKMQALFNLRSEPKYGIFNEPIANDSIITGETSIRKMCCIFNVNDPLGLF